MTGPEAARPASRLAVAVGGVLVASILLGGGTRSGFLADTVLQAVSVPVLVACLIRIFRAGFPPLAWAAISLAAVAALLPLLQVVPIPMSVSTSAAGAVLKTEIEALFAANSGWLPLSLSPRATGLAMLAALPALAVFLGTCRLEARERRHLTLALLAVGMISVFVGLLQVAQGPDSALRFFSFTNPSEAVGFFANRNHFSALLYVLLLMAAAWSVYAGSRFADTRSRRRFDADILLPCLLGFAALVILVAAQTFTRSRAGLGLTIVALLGAGLLTFSGRKRERGLRPAHVVVGAGLFGVLLAIQFALYRILERFDADPLSDARIPFARNTVSAAWSHLPFGSGLGTFVPIYGIFERPEDALVDTFANRAHNDFLEIWLETGLTGAALFAAFVVWFLWALVRVWRKQEAVSLDVILARAASLIVLLLLAHSVVDYPLRTAALLTVFAFACALLVPPPGEPEQLASTRSAKRSMAAAPKPVPSKFGPPKPRPLKPSPPKSGPAPPRPSPVGHGLFVTDWPTSNEISPTQSATPKADHRHGVPGKAWDQDVAWPAEWKRDNNDLSHFPAPKKPTDSE